VNALEVVKWLGVGALALLLLFIAALLFLGFWKEYLKAKAAPPRMEDIENIEAARQALISYVTRTLISTAATTGDHSIFTDGDRLMRKLDEAVMQARVNSQRAERQK
jgi:hypothetical protein